PSLRERGAAQAVAEVINPLVEELAEHTDVRPPARSWAVREPATTGPGRPTRSESRRRVRRR
ncbi:MAG: hypothetical protein M3519_08960, partial [Actinomycetota bacterium]|nr:hypothetical protein [Actinomycetota bacterium]